MRKVGNGQRPTGSGGGESGGPRGGRVQGDDHARDGGVNVHGIAGMSLIDAENTQLLIGSFEVGLAVVLAVLGDFELALRDRAFVIQELVAGQGRPGKLFIGDCLDVAVKRCGNIRRLDLQNELALTHVIANIYLERGNTAIGN